MPLLVGDEVRGVISLQNVDREHAFSDSDVRLLQTLANSMSVALENARLFDETQRRTRETAALAEVGRDISSTLDLATVMDRIARHAKDLLGADNSAIFLPDAERRRPTGRSSRSATSPTQIKADDGRGRRGHHRQPARRAAAPSSSTTPTRDPRAIQIAGTDAGGARAADGGAAAGRRDGARARWPCGAPAGSRSTTRELEFLVGLSLQAAVAIENARLFAEAQQRAAELDTVNTVSQQLAGKLDLAALIELVGEQIRTVFNADLAYVALLDRATGMIDFPYQYGESAIGRCSTARD